MNEKESFKPNQLSSERWSDRHRKKIIGSALGALLVGGLGIGAVIKVNHAIDNRIAQAKAETTEEVIDSMIAKGVTNDLSAYSNELQKQFLEQFGGMTSGFINDAKRQLEDRIGKNGLPKIDPTRLECRGDSAARLCFDRDATRISVTKTNTNRTVPLYGQSKDGTVIQPEAAMNTLGKDCSKTVDDLSEAIKSATGIVTVQELKLVSAAALNIFEAPELACPKK